MRLPVLTDSFARRVRYLRVSLTDRCNYRCTYCMPPEGVELLPREQVLTFEEIERLVRVFARLGVERVRLTGGEPTIRKGLPELVARLAKVPGIRQVVMTTNGHYLAELAADLVRAGLAEVNVSVDTLDPDKFARITRRGELHRVLDGIEAVRAAGIGRIKLNVVALRGFNDGEIGAICDYAWARGIIPRFIEFMPMSDGALYAPFSLLDAATIRRLVEAHVGAALSPDIPPVSSALASPPAVPVGPARYFGVPGGSPPRVVGIISAMSEHFCDSCNRVRLSSVGELHTCLAHDESTDLRAILRNGGSDEAIEEAIRAAVEGKRKGHEFQRAGCGGPRKHMVSIGG